MPANVTAFGSGAPSTATVTNTSASVIAANVNRKGLLVFNTGSNICYLAEGTTAVSGRGIPLPANAAYEWDALNLFQGQLNAISASGTTLSVEERT